MTVMPTTLTLSRCSAASTLVKRPGLFSKKTEICLLVSTTSPPEKYPPRPRPDPKCSEDLHWVQTYCNRPGGTVQRNVTGRREPSLRKVTAPARYVAIVPVGRFSH